MRCLTSSRICGMQAYSYLTVEQEGALDSMHEVQCVGVGKCPKCESLRIRLMQDGATASRELIVALRLANWSMQAASLLPSAQYAGRCQEDSCASEVLRLSRSGFAVALAIAYPSHPFVLPHIYGHIWPTMRAFWECIVQPRLRLQLANNASWSVLYLPAGAHIGGQRVFEEIGSVFTSNATKLQIERVPWVPFCMHGCCWSVGAPPTTARLALMELRGWQTAKPRAVSGRARARNPPTAVKRGPTSSGAWFREDVWRCLGTNRSASTSSAAGDTRRVVWVLAGSGSNKRRIHAEAQLIERFRVLLRTERPAWHLDVIDTAAVSYADEIRTIAGAHVLISLFGSSLHNCRYMAPGSVVIEIHGALKHDFGHTEDRFYKRLCGPLGIRWVGYAPADFRPRPSDNLLGWEYCSRNGTSAKYVAFVDFDEFGRLFRRVLNAEWVWLDETYSAQVLANPDPRAARGRKHSHGAKGQKIMRSYCPQGSSRVPRSKRMFRPLRRGGSTSG